jgi:hypothetical protein
VDSTKAKSRGRIQGGGSPTTLMMGALRSRTPRVSLAIEPLLRPVTGRRWTDIEGPAAHRTIGGVAVDLTSIGGGMLWACYDSGVETLL